MKTVLETDIGNSFGKARAQCRDFSKNTRDSPHCVFLLRASAAAASAAGAPDRGENVSTIKELKPASLLAGHHPLGTGERERQRRLMERNAALAVRFGNDDRMRYAAMAVMTPMAGGVAYAAVEEAAVSGWWARPRAERRDRAILYIHGGGYHLGDAASHCGLASQIAARTRCPVFVMDYPLAPEHRFPAAYDAAVRARNWLARSGFERLALIGDSAGGGLALAAQSEPMPRGSLACTCVFSPWTDLALTSVSFSDPEMYDPILKPEVLTLFARSYLAGANPRDRRASPVFDVPADLAPLYIQVGSNDLLLDDAQNYAYIAARRGAAPQLDIFEGMHHVFQRDVGTMETATLALDLAARFVTKHW